MPVDWPWFVRCAEHGMLLSVKMSRVCISGITDERVVLCYVHMTAHEIAVMVCQPIKLEVSLFAVRSQHVL